MSDSRAEADSSITFKAYTLRLAFYCLSERHTQPCGCANTAANGDTNTGGLRILAQSPILLTLTRRTRRGSSCVRRELLSVPLDECGKRDRIPAGEPVNVPGNRKHRAASPTCAIFAETGGGRSLTLARFSRAPEAHGALFVTTISSVKSVSPACAVLRRAFRILHLRFSVFVREPPPFNPGSRCFFGQLDARGIDFLRWLTDEMGAMRFAGAAQSGFRPRSHLWRALAQIENCSSGGP